MSACVVIKKRTVAFVEPDVSSVAAVVTTETPVVGESDTASATSDADEVRNAFNSVSSMFCTQSSIRFRDVEETVAVAEVSQARECYWGTDDSWKHKPEKSEPD